MYAYITGKVDSLWPNAAVIEAAGVGYLIFTNAYTIAALKAGEQAKLFTRLIVREDEQSLYGFHTMEEKTRFEKLIAISGIGPKVALSVLSTLKVSDIGAAVISGNSAAFEAVPGIGKKTAQRLVLELKEKVSVDDAIGTAGEALPVDVIGEAAAALMGLGYQRQEALNALSAVQALGDTAEDLVLLALKRMAR